MSYTEHSNAALLKVERACYQHSIQGSLTIKKDRDEASAMFQEI